MRVSVALQLVSAVIGFVGTLILYFKSYALEPFQGGVFGSDAVNPENDHIRARNLSRQRWNKGGLLLLCLSFLGQLVALFL